MEKKELLGCPFCGEKPDVLKSGLVGHACFVLDREIRADRDAWNTRAAVTDEQFAFAVHDGHLWKRVDA